MKIKIRNAKFVFAAGPMGRSDKMYPIIPRGLFGNMLDSQNDPNDYRPFTLEISGVDEEGNTREETQNGWCYTFGEELLIINSGWDSCFSTSNGSTEDQVIVL